MAEKKLKYDQVESAPSKIKNAADVEQFEYLISEGFQITGAGDTTVSFNAANKRITINSTPGSGGGGAVTSFNSRTGGVVATEGDYSLNLLGDVTINTPINNNTLLYNSSNTQWENKPLNTSLIPESTNLYFTETRVRNTPITGFLSGAGTLTPTDTLLQAINKLDGNDALKAPLSSPAFTGTPTAPTATAGTNTTQLATTAFVTNGIATADAGNVKLTGNQTITGQKIFNSGSLTSIQVASSSSSASAIFTNSANGKAIQANASFTAGTAISAQTNNSSIGLNVESFGSGNAIISNQIGTGLNYVGQNNGTTTFTVDKFGATTATSFIKSSAPATNLLLAGGGDIAQSTFFPAPTGLTTNYLPKWNGSGFGNSSLDEPTQGIYRINRATSASGDYISEILTRQTNSSGFDIASIRVVQEANVYEGAITFRTNTTGNAGMSEKVRITSGGNALFGTTTDNGVDKLQVNGSLFADRYKFGAGSASAAGVVSSTSSFGLIVGSIGYGISTNQGVGGLDLMSNQSGTSIRLWAGTDNTSPTQVANFINTGSTIYNPLTVNGNITASPATASNHVVVKSQLDAVRPYKVYTALLSQSGTNAPVATVLENTLGGTVVWSRTATGEYDATLSNAFTTNKTVCFITIGANTSNNIVSFKSYQSTSSVVKLQTYRASTTAGIGENVDSVLLNTTFEIRVFN